ncbi:hypothetical protein CAPTEDRAFT_205801 [Capitella teleta]|uniref:Uncharacterized protein n=1 Tax=Capitella teleta TaxID=283909 RepID=R7V255_CAPTE|nr:hypothetical protein CAPTEDRAFT_205801 [Capitella teleta]|eukprot:ELU10411.1 hypothetical protein CAPTEDRAFT_205801 [Capitella teleta]
MVLPVSICLLLQGKDFHIVRSLKAVCSNALVRDLLPTIPYEKPAYKVNTVPSTSIEDGLLPPRSLLEAPMSMKQYAKRFSLLLHIEEHQMQLDIRRYDMEGVTMQVFKEDKKLLCLDVPGVAEKRPSVLPHDHLFVCPLTQNGVRDRTEYKGYVHRVLNERVALGFGKKLMAIFLPNMKFAVRFVVNRYPLRMQHRAVQLAVEHNCMPWLFPTPDFVILAS